MNAGRTLGQASLTKRRPVRIIHLNYTRLASTNFGLHAHFGGFLFSGVRQ